MAAILNRYPRVAADVDIPVSDAPDNLRRRLDRLAGWAEGWARELNPKDGTPQERSIRVTEDFDLPIPAQMRGHPLDHCRPRLRHRDAAGVRIPYLGPADLMLLKQQSCRDRDKLDVTALQEILAAQAGEGPVGP